MAKKAKQNGQATEEKPRRRPKQGHLEGMEPPTIPEIDTAADAYVEARDARMRLGEREVELRTLLHAQMKQHGLQNYEYDGKTVCIVADEKIKVRAKKAEEDGDEDA